MFYKYLLTSSATLAVLSTAAFADGLVEVQSAEPVYGGILSQINATIMLELGDQVESSSGNTDYQNQEISVSVSGNFSSRFGMQLDAHYLNWAHYDSSYDIFGAAFHLTYDLSESLSVGTFYNLSTWNNGQFKEFGLEASFQTQNIRLDAIIAQERVIGGGTDTDYQAIFLGYSLLENLTIGYGLGHYEGFATTQEASATYHLKNGNNLKLKVIDTKNEGVISTIAWSKDFGQGSKFRRPDYTSIFNVW